MFESHFHGLLQTLLHYFLFFFLHSGFIFTVIYNYFIQRLNVMHIQHHNNQYTEEMKVITHMNDNRLAHASVGSSPATTISSNRRLESLKKKKKKIEHLLADIVLYHLQFVYIIPTTTIIITAIAT